MSRSRAATLPEATSTWSALLGIGLLLVSGAVVMLPGALEPYVLPKATVAGVGAALVLWSGLRGRVPVGVVTVVAAALVTLTLAAALSEAPLAAVSGRYPRYEGALVIALYVASLVAGSRAGGDPDRNEWLAVVVLRVLALAGVVGVAAMTWQQLTGSGDRPFGLFGNASDAGAWAVLALGPLGSGFLSRRDVASGVGCVAVVGVVVLAGSRGALLGLVVVAAVLLLLQARGRTRLWVALALGVVIVTAVLVPGTGSRLTGTSPLADATVTGRRLLYADTVRLIGRHVLLGVGPSGFVDRIGSAHAAAWARQVGPANPPDSPHDVILQAAAAGGIVLLAVLAVGVVVVCRAAVRSFRSGRPLAVGVVAGLLGYGCALLFHFTSPVTTPTALFFLGWLVATSSTAAVGDVGRRVTAVAVGLVAVVLAFAAVAEIPLRRSLEAMAAGDSATARAQLDTAARLRPWDHDIWLRGGHAATVAAQAGLIDPGLAQSLLSRALATAPHSTEVRKDLALALELGGQQATAAALLDTALRDDPFDVDLMLQRGVLAAELHDYGTAEQMFLAVTRLRPEDPQPWQDLARLYDIQGRTSDAADAARQAQLRGG